MLTTKDTPDEMNLESYLPKFLLDEVSQVNYLPPTYSKRSFGSGYTSTSNCETGAVKTNSGKKRSSNISLLSSNSHSTLDQSPPRRSFGSSYDEGVKMTLTYHLKEMIRVAKDLRIKQLLLFLRENVNILINSQTGSGVLQNKLQYMDAEDFHLLFKFTKNSLANNMKDRFGNYFMKFFFKACTNGVRRKIIQKIKNNICELGTSYFANHCLRSLIEASPSPGEKEALVNIFADDRVLNKLCFDENGTHVVQKLLINVEENFRKRMNNFFTDNVGSLTRDKSAVLAFNVFMKASSNRKSIKTVLKSLTSDLVSFSKHEYGNYAVQAAIEAWVGHLDLLFPLFVKMSDKLLPMCKDKFASNVLHKALDILILHSNKGRYMAVLERVLITPFTCTNFNKIFNSKSGRLILERIICLSNTLSLGATQYN